MSGRICATLLASKGNIHSEMNHIRMELQREPTEPSLKALHLCFMRHICLLPSGVMHLVLLCTVIIGHLLLPMISKLLLSYGTSASLMSPTSESLDVLPLSTSRRIRESSCSLILCVASLLDTLQTSKDGISGIQRLKRSTTLTLLYFMSRAFLVLANSPLI